MDTKYLTQNEQTCFINIGKAKAAYFQAQANLRSALQIEREATARLKRAKLILSGRPTEKGGIRPTYTEAQLCRAEMKKITAEALISSLNIWGLKEELRNRFLAYCFLRGKMSGKYNLSWPPDIKTIAQYADTDEETILYWIKNPTSKRGTILSGHLAEKQRIKELEKKKQDADHARLVMERDARLEQSKADRCHEWALGYKIRAEEKAAEIANLEKEIQEIEASFQKEVAR
ncbi:MAG: hypothetical protein WC824_13875 [Bacteroidota bacterium]|jgi:hypothetical protein